MEPIKIPECKKSKTIRDLKINEIAWTDLEAMWVDENDNCFIELSYYIKSKKTKGYSLKVQRKKSGYKVFINLTRKKWSYFLDEERSMTNSKPVVEFDSLEINIKTTKKDLEDQILKLEVEKLKAINEQKYELAADLRNQITEIGKAINEKFEEKNTTISESPS